MEFNHCFFFQTFNEANLCQTLNDNIAKAGYSKLTPVQEYGIPVTLAGRDLIACAQTGSGKTVSHFATWVLPPIQTIECFELWFLPSSLTVFYWIEALYMISMNCRK